MYKYFNIYAIILDIQENLLTCMLKGVESNESWSWRQSVIRSYARNLFPKIVENKEFPHSYLKHRFTNIYPFVGFDYYRCHFCTYVSPLQNIQYPFSEHVRHGIEFCMEKLVQVELTHIFSAIDYG